jgi:hypothetical protein
MMGGLMRRLTSSIVCPLAIRFGAFAEIALNWRTGVEFLDGATATRGNAPPPIGFALAASADFTKPISSIIAKMTRMESSLIMDISNYR